MGNVDQVLFINSLSHDIFYHPTNKSRVQGVRLMYLSDIRKDRTRNLVVQSLWSGNVSLTDVATLRCTVCQGLNSEDILWIGYGRGTKFNLPDY